MLRSVCVEILAIVMTTTACHPVPSETASTVSTRTVAHAMGTTQVPIAPERVVVLDTAPLDAAFALEIQPVGTAVYKEFPPYLGDRVGDITLVGDPNQPNLEAILGLNPDLILWSQPGSNLYEKLSQIAPTVFTDNGGQVGKDAWKDNFLLYAEALGKAKQAEKQLQGYQQRVQQLQEKIGQPQALKVSVLIVNDNVRAYTSGSFSGSVLQDVGFSRPFVQDDPEGYALQLSPEALDDIDGDYIFLVYSTYRPGGFQKDDFMTNPIWSQLRAVQQERVCEVNGDVWIAGRNILAANQILTDIEDCLK
ncbi:MAG: iron-siderophore ABC transporter substrate-binding protein [Cyanobacteria bacterium P01_B01_bin.77]